MKFSNKLILVTVLAVPILGNAADTDNDGIDDSVDNCQLIANQGQEDTDRDFFGNACDADLNNDGIVNTLDIGQLRKDFGKSDKDYGFNPDADLNSDDIVNSLDIGKLRSLFGKEPGPHGQSPAELDPPTVTVDLTEQPSIATLPGIDGGSTRQLVKLTSSSDANNNLEFTANEVILSTSDITEKDAFLNRWNATVIASFNIDKLFPNTNIPNPIITYVINVDTSTVDTSQLNSQLPENDQYMHGAYLVSSLAGQKLLALVAAERVNNDLDISLNIRFKSNHVGRRNSIEAMIGEVGPNSPGGGIFPYVDNAFLWPYLEYDPDLNPNDSYFPLDTGVSEAWRILWGAGIHWSTSSPKVLILDAGFMPNHDVPFPDFGARGPFYVPNPDKCGAEVQTPACKWHGTHVAMSGFAFNNNEFGAAGPGAPVSAGLNVVNSPGDVGSFIVYLAHDLPDALLSMPRIINMSFSVDIHEVLWWLSGAEALNDFMIGFEASNMLVVAAAGNHGKNLDSDEYRTIPCELRFVFCVGATNFGNPRKAWFSNFGNRSIDIFAPGVLWSVDAELADWRRATRNDDLSIISGTSFSAPFVSGVAALILAADPSISSGGIRSILRNTAHTDSPDPDVPRHINALAAIKPLLGNTVPYVSFTSTGLFNFIQGTGQLDYEYADLDGDTVTITWRSDIDGVMGTRNTTVPTNTSRVRGSLSLAGLSAGTHTIRIIISDNLSHGLIGDVYDEIEVIIINPVPTVGILQPADGQSFFLSNTIPLRATSYDENTLLGAGPLQDFQIEWFINSEAKKVATGHSASIPASRLGVGAHTIRLQGVDHQNARSAIDSVSISIIPDPANLPPEITITSPTHPTNLGYSTVSQKVILDFSVVDPEGDEVDWTWYKRVNNGSIQFLNVQSELYCRFYFQGICGSFGTRYYTMLNHVTTFTTYQLILYGIDEFGHVSTPQEVTVTMNTFG